MFNYIQEKILFLFDFFYVPTYKEFKNIFLEDIKKFLLQIKKISIFFLILKCVHGFFRLTMEVIGMKINALKIIGVFLLYILNMFDFTERVQKILGNGSKTFKSCFHVKLIIYKDIEDSILY